MQLAHCLCRSSAPGDTFVKSSRQLIKFRRLWPVLCQPSRRQ
nr:MAG TPA: hypothetical protein [Caudoviricetes sp.]